MTHSVPNALDGQAALSAEAEAFDSHARERVAHGHIPDLRRVVPCDWFYNNIWRRPYLVDMECGRNLRFTLAHATGSRVLEVGSGPGHMSLEMARNGYHVTGLELSPASVEIARRFADENPYHEGFGSLRYVVADFLEWEAPETFDTVMMFGALHHFEDPAAVLARVESLLSPGCRVVVVEPARDGLSEREMSVVVLIRSLLSAYGGWYEELDAVGSRDEFAARTQAALREFTEASDDPVALQSPNDNSAYAEEMLVALRGRFAQVAHQPGAALCYALGGGVRGGSEEQVEQVAKLLHLFDQAAVENGLLKPSEFLWAGEKKNA